MKKLNVLLALAFALCGSLGAITADEAEAYIKANAAMWLDASSLADFTFNAAGQVTAWKNKADKRSTYGDAVAYTVPSHSAAYATRQLVGGRMAVNMGGVNSGIDFKWQVNGTDTRMTKVRTLFLATTIQQSMQAFWLGDTATYHFHRGEAGQYIAGYSNIAGVRQDGTAISNLSGTKPPTDFRIYTVTTKSASCSNRMTLDRNCSNYNRNGGRVLSEEIVFEGDAVLDETTIAAIEEYLRRKWRLYGWTDTSAADMTDGQTLDGSAVGAVTGQSVTLDAVPAFANGYQQFGFGQVTWNCGTDVIISNSFTQVCGILDASGATIKPTAAPLLYGTIAYSNVVLDCTSYSARYRPEYGTEITIGAGATLKTNSGVFLDKGNVEMTIGPGAAVDIAGDVGVTVDYSGASNRLVVAGGTLTSTAWVKILTQGSGGVGVLTMADGAINAPRLSIAGSWNSSEGVIGTARVEIGGGTITLTDNVVIGANNGTHGTAYVHFGGGTIISPNGLRCYYNDTDHITFDGTVFRATKDNANYLILHKASSADLTIGAGGLILDDAGFNVGFTLATMTGTGAFVKRGAGTVTLAAAENTDIDVQVEAGTLALTDASAATYAKSIELAENTTLQLGLTWSPAERAAFAGKVKLPASGTATIKVACTDQIPTGTYAIATTFEGSLEDNLELVIEGPAAGTVEGNLSLTDAGELNFTVTKSNNPGGDFVWAPADSSATWSTNSVAWKQKDGDGTLYNYFDHLPLWFDGTAAYPTVKLTETVTPNVLHFTGGTHTLTGGGTISGSHDIRINDATVVNSGVTLDQQPITISNGTYRVNANASGLLGNSAVPITVKNGGALDVCMEEDMNLLSAAAKAKTVYIEGTGPDGNGAYLNGGKYNAWRGDAPQIVLTGDASIGGKGGYRMQRGIVGNGHTLTIAAPIAGSDMDGLSSVDIDGSALTVKKLVLAENARFCFTHAASINATEGVEIGAGARFEVWDSTANINPNITVKAGAGDSASATSIMGCGWKTGLYQGTVTVADGAHLQLGISGHAHYDDPQLFYKPFVVEGAGTLTISAGDQYFLQGLASTQPVTFDGAGTAVFGNNSYDISGNIFPAGGFVEKSGTHVLYLRPNYKGMKMSAPTAIRSGTLGNNLYPQQNVPYGVVDITANTDAFVMSLGMGNYGYANVRVCTNTTLHLEQLNASCMASLKDGYLSVDGGTLELGQYGLANTISPYAPEARLRLNSGTLRSTAAWSMAYGFCLGFYGAEGVPFEWNVNYDTSVYGALCGTGPVRLSGAANFTSANARTSGVCDGKWTIASTGANNLTAVSAFAGGLELATNVTATINLGTDTPGEGYVGMTYTHNASQRETTLIAMTDLICPQMVSAMTYLNGRTISDWVANNTCVGYEGEFYVSAENAGQKWTFAGCYDDYIAFSVDGTQVFASGHCAAACGTTAAALTEGWHTFRVFAYDISGNDGPVSGTAWNTAKMSLGWRVGESTSTAATDYAKFDTDTLRLRPIARKGLLWQQVANPDNNTSWRDNNLAWTWAGVTNQISMIHTKSVYSQLSAKVSRFSGWFYVSAARAGTWHFWGNWDDDMLVAIDGDDSGINGKNATPNATRDFTLQAGWHRLELRLRDISGGYGPWSGSVAIQVQINGGDWVLFDERNFDFMPTHPELMDVCAKVGTLGGALTLNEGATLVNASTKPARITGTLAGTGTLSGAYAFTGTNSCWSVTGLGTRRTLDGKATLDVTNGDALAGLAQVKVVFANKPSCSVYPLAAALGQTAQTAAAITVDAQDAAGNDYSENFTATVQNGQLVLVNSKPSGVVILIR